ncbi:MAG: hypothetical protein K6E72_03965 [Saccharofermentans sp.]|nr:hypothetical protein [Saccharofermentans sp.]
MVVTEYVVQNWPLILVLLGFTTSLISTVFLEKKIVIRMYALIAEILILSILVFVEFYLAEQAEFVLPRSFLIAVRYSATPFLIAQIIYTIIKRQKWYVFIPSIVLTLIDFISIPTGIVFFIDDTGTMKRGPLGLLPYVMVGVYCVWLVVLMIMHSSKQSTERIPIVYFCFAFLAGTIMPFIIGKEYAQLFCTTIAISVFVYYVFSILQVTKKDPLTGLLNRQAYYADISNEPEEISALISIDMNGLKVSEEEVINLTKRINEKVNATPYSCSIGYSYSHDGKKPIDQLLSESDTNMYAEKQLYYEKNKDKKKRG